MSSSEPVPEVLVTAAPAPQPLERAERDAAPGRVHLVVVTARPLTSGETAEGGNCLRTRFWHPRDRRWSENDFESLEHALRLFVDESGWVLRQEQGLDAPLAVEWIFEAHRGDFAGATPEEILQEIGMSPESVEKLLEDVPPASPEG